MSHLMNLFYRCKHRKMKLCKDNFYRKKDVRKDKNNLYFYFYILFL